MDQMGLISSHGGRMFHCCKFVCSISSKANVIRKFAYKVKYISQINRGLIMFFFGNSRIRLLKINWLNWEQNQKKNSR